MSKTRLMLYAAGSAAVMGIYLMTKTNEKTEAKPKPVADPTPAGNVTPLPSSPAVVQPQPAPRPKPNPTTREILINRVEAAIKKEVPVRPKSETPESIRALATYLVTICAEQQYPLDLAFGHAFTESSLALNAVNPSSGAKGPLQVTRIAATDIGVPWPLGQASSVRAGILYMKLLRSRHAECGRSVKVTLQHYGLGRGNWIKLNRDGCGPSPCTNNLSVWREECGCGRGYSSLVMAVAKRHPELKTVSWWEEL